MSKKIITFFMAMRFLTASAMEKEKQIIIKEWPKQEALKVEEDRQYLLSLRPMHPFFELILTVRNQKQLKDPVEADIEPIKKKWKECKHDEIFNPKTQRIISQQVLLTTAITYCMDGIGAEIACYLANRKAGLYPHTYIWGIQGLLQATATGPNAWGQDLYHKFAKICIKRGMPLNIRNEFGNLPLHHIASTMDLATVAMACLDDSWPLLGNYSGYSSILYAHFQDDLHESNYNPIATYLEDRAKSIWLAKDNQKR